MSPRRPADPAAAGADAGATLALTILTLGAAAGMGRLFAGASYLVPFAAAAVVAHLAMWSGRRARAPVAVAGVGALCAVALVAAWLVLPETTTLGVPGPGTLAAARAALAQAWADFAAVVAPAPVTDGFLLAGMVGVGATAVLADWAAFRMGVLFEAVVPSFTLFVFTATLGNGRGRSMFVALYLLAVLAFLVVHQAGLQERGAAWFASRSRRGTGALLQGAAALGLVAVTAALVLGPRLPGAAAEPLMAVGEDGPGGRGRRTTVSPLVDIRGRLVDRSTTEVFSVRTSARSYWRLTALDTFDGAIWSADARYRDAGRRLDPAHGAVPGERVAQEFTIASLSSIWLPAAYRPDRVEGVDDVSWNRELGSLITSEDTTDGLTYRVESVVPRFSRDDLAGATAGLAPRQLERFLRLPTVSRRVLAEAARIAGATDGTPYAKALALQDHFRTGFTYDLQAVPGHDGRALERFLFATRRGYCEQFAGAYAVLARAVGLPTRVAVGFTPGEPGADGRLHVRGLNAHAWPEVFIAGAGWVAFEPTPGRGAPGAEEYTGVPEAQARPESPSTATTAAPSTTAVPGDTATPSTTVAPGAAGTKGSATSDARRRSPFVLAALGAAALAAVAGAVPAAKAVRRRRRRARATTAAARVLVAWQEAADAVERVGVGRRPAETLDEHARRAAAASSLPPEAASSLAALAGHAAAASYAAGPVSTTVVERAVADAAAVERSVGTAAPRHRRLVWALDPRPLVR